MAESRKSIPISILNVPEIGPSLLTKTLCPTSSASFVVGHYQLERRLLAILDPTFTATSLAVLEALALRNQSRLTSNSTICFAWAWFHYLATYEAVLWDCNGDMTRSWSDAPLMIALATLLLNATCTWIMTFDWIIRHLSRHPRDVHDLAAKPCLTILWKPAIMRFVAPLSFATATLAMPFIQRAAAPFLIKN